MSLEEIRAEFIRYEERRDKLKLLYIELTAARDMLGQMASPGPGMYSLLTIESETLDRLLVDVFSLIHEDALLVKLLINLRTQFRVIGTKQRMFFSQMSLPLSGKDVTTVQHNAWIAEKATSTNPTISLALKLLEDRFKLRNPLEDPRFQEEIDKLIASLKPQADSRQ